MVQAKLRIIGINQINQEAIAMDNLFGFDMNFDGKLDMVDDLLFLELMEEIEKAQNDDENED